MRPMPIETLEKVSALYASDDDSTEAKLALLPAMAGIVQEGIVGWNLKAGGEPVSCANVGIGGVELVSAIIQAWQQAANEVSAPLPQGSPDGGPSPEVLIPMEIPSASHVSLNTPN